MKTHWLLYISFFILGAFLVLYLRNHYRPESHCRIVHVVLDVAGGQAHHGCPEGSTVLHNFFTEKDGSKIDACMKPDGEDCVDRLDPGESMKIFPRMEK